MASTGAGYDLSVSTFSPDGRVFQVEYANKAVEKSGTVVGIRCVDGVVLGVEKTIPSKMLVRAANKRIYTGDVHVGLALAGLSADARQIVTRTREESSSYRNNFGAEIPGHVLANRIAGYVHAFTQYWYLRPFGCSTLLATYDNDGPGLYQIEPFGLCYRYFGTAIGKHTRTAKSELEKIDFKTYTCREAIKEVARILVKYHDDLKEKDYEIEISWISDESKRKHTAIPAALLEEAVTRAKELKQKEAFEDKDKDD